MKRVRDGGVFWVVGEFWCRFIGMWVFCLVWCLLLFRFFNRRGCWVLDGSFVFCGVFRLDGFLVGF